MKLINIHIYNFGNLHNFDFTFHDGINPILKDNGTGKSTLASFIRIMFYGFDNERKRDDVENERHRFNPWQGGIYGGNLTFLFNHHKYRISRKFGNTHRSDQFFLYDATTNLISHDFDENIGEQLFGVNSFSFERTVFVAQQDCVTDVTSDIHAKIGNVANQTADMSNYDPAQEKLKNLCNQLTPDRKTGKIYKLKADLQELENRIEDLTNETKGLENLYYSRQKLIDEKERLQETGKSLDKKIKKYSDYQNYRSIIEKYNALVGQKNKAEITFQSEKQKLNGNIPTLEELDKAINTVQSQNTLNERSLNYQFNSEENIRFQYLQRLFSQHIPDNDELSSIEDLAKQLRELEQRNNASRLSADEIKRLKQYQLLFNDKKPDISEIQKYIDEYRSLSQINEQIRSFSDQLKFQSLQDSTTKSSSSSKSNGNTLFIFFAVILLVVTFLFYYLNIITFPVLAVLIIISLVIILIEVIENNKNKGLSDKNKSQNTFRSLQESLNRAQSEADSIKKHVSIFLSDFGISYSEDNALDYLYKIRSAAQEYLRLCERESDLSNDRNNTSEEYIRKVLHNKLGIYFQLDDNPDYLSLCIQLSNDSAEYKKMLRSKKSYDDSISQYNNKQEYIRQFAEYYQLNLGSDPSSSLRKIRDVVISVNRSEKELADRKNELQQYSTEHDIKSLLNKNADVSDKDLNDLTDSLNRNHTRLTEKENDIKQLQSKIDNLEEKKLNLTRLIAEKEQINSKIIEDSHFYQILSKAQDYLEKAKNSFSSKYMNPIKDSFNKYYELLTDDTADQFVLDSNLNIAVNKYALQRDTRSLSQGYQDLIGICRRMAMIDAMYKNEKPFLIFDDPFVNLDAQKLDAGLSFLNRISENYQVIYLTCHDSRMPK